MELDETGVTISYQEFYPFGTVAYRVGEVSCEYKFTGKERDDFTGMDYFGARYYISWMGRWASSDPKRENEDGLNLYTYCRNNPVTLTDPDGMETALKFLDYTGDANDAEAKAMYVNSGGRISDGIGVYEISQGIVNAEQVNGVTSMTGENLEWNRIGNVASGGSSFNSTPATSEESHEMLGKMSYAPVLGSPAAAVNAGLYAIEGDFKNAGISALQIIPFEKWFAKGFNAIRNNSVVKAATDKIAEKVDGAVMGAIEKVSEKVVLASTNWGKYLEGKTADAIGQTKAMIGNMVRPHAHHIVFKGLFLFKPVKRDAVEASRKILMSHGINPYTAVENLVWAPNIKGQHGTDAALHILAKLQEAEREIGTKEAIIDVLKQLGREAAKRK